MTSSQAASRAPMSRGFSAIYDWIVERTYRDAEVRGCGTGDIVAMLKSANLGGKCADLNALFVGLVRARGIPARDIYGIRVAPSSFGYKSLGVNSNTITKAQHCRAEVQSVGARMGSDGPGRCPQGNPDEKSPGNLAADDERVRAAKQTLFGSWEANWIAYNAADNLMLPGANGGKASFLMYPEAETVLGRLDFWTRIVPVYYHLSGSGHFKNNLQISIAILLATVAT